MGEYARLDHEIPGNPSRVAYSYPWNKEINQIHTNEDIRYSL